jgi:hypothetical protein
MSKVFDRFYKMMGDGLNLSTSSPHYPIILHSPLSTRNTRHLNAADKVALGEEEEHQ